MLGKYAWRIQKDPSSLCARILKAKYFPATNFFSSALGHKTSYTWCSIHVARDLVRRGTGWKIGGGETVRLWGGCWLDDDKSFVLSTPLVDGFNDIVVKDIFIPCTRQWDTEVFS